MPDTRNEKYMRYAITTLGVIAIIAMVILSIYFPEPTKWQELVFRGCLALGVASVAAEVPGFIKLSARVHGWGSYITMFAGGALAIFVLIWLVNPPGPADKLKPSKGDSPTSETDEIRIDVSTSGDGSPAVGIVKGDALFPSVSTVREKKSADSEKKDKK